MQASVQQGQAQPQGKSAAPAVEKSPREKELDGIHAEIDKERARRLAVLDEIRRARRRMAYKEAEREALSKLSEMGKKTKNIGYLRRLKEKLEFRIATEATTLSAEKDLVRKVREVDNELQEALNTYRTKRRMERVAGEIEEAKKKIDEKEAQLKELDTRLDTLYSGMRKILGAPKRTGGKPIGKKPHSEPKPMEISLADIAVIKDRKNKDSEDNEDESSEEE